MVTFLKSNVILTPDYEDDNIKLVQTPAELKFWLTGGQSEALVSAAVGVNKHTGNIITAQLSFPFITDTLNNRVELVSNDFISDRSPKLTLVSDNAVIYETCAYTEIGEYLNRQNVTGQKSGITLFNAVQPSLHSIYSSFVDIAGQNRVTVSTKKNLAEKYKDSYVAYKNGRLSHIFDPDYDNPDDYHLEPLKSKFRGLTAHIVGSLHQNVRHSTGDTDTTTPGPTYDAWIDFWLAHTGTAVKPVCCYFTGVLGANGHTCNATVAGSWLCFGNHTVASTVANTVVDPRTNGVVYIMPACNASNQWRNTNIFTLQVPTTSADLDDYHN